MNLMERRQASWSKRSAANRAYPRLSQSTFDDNVVQPEAYNYRPTRSTPPMQEPLDLASGDCNISPDEGSASFDRLPLANTPLDTPLPKSDSNGSLGSTSTEFSDARTTFSSPPLSRSTATSPLENTSSAPSSSPPPPHGTVATPRALSSAALAAIADTPPRPRSSTSVSRPPLPPKSSARNSLSESQRSSLFARPPASDSLHSQRGSEVFSDTGEPALRKMPSLTKSGSRANSDANLMPATSGAPLDLSHPRPRPPLPSANSRTPALSQAGSTASSRFSAMSEHGSGLRNSAFFQSPEMTEEGYSCRTSSVAESDWSKVKSDGATPYTTDNDEPVGSLDDTPEWPELARSQSGSRPVGIATLHLDTSSIDQHPSPPTGMPPTALLSGLGIGWEEGDLQKNLDELSKYAKTLPSPLPSPHPRSELESPLDRWQAGAQMQPRTPEKGHAANALEPPRDRPPPVPPIPDLGASVPTATIRQRARSRSASRTRAPSRKPSLVDLAASSSSSPYFGGRSGKTRAPQHVPPVPASHPPRERERSSTHDSESYLSMDDTDFLSTDDEDGSRKMRYLSFGASGDNSMSSSNGGGDYYGVGGPGSGGSHSAGTLSPNGLNSFSNLARIRNPNSPGLDDVLWNSDFARGTGDAGEQADEVSHRILDWTGKPIEMTEVPSSTTHLILARTATPLLIEPLLNVTVPNLSHGLVVLDISSCGLTEVPLVITSCTALEELDIHGNQLSGGTLPSFLGSMPSLLVLIADACGLASLPSSLSHLSRLHTLAVRENRLRAIPSWLSRISCLEVLLVDGNPLHWQYQNLVRPLLTAVPDAPDDSAQGNGRYTPSPLPSHNFPPASYSLPGSRSRTPSGTHEQSSTTSLSPPPTLAQSPTGRKFSFSGREAPTSAPPLQNSFNELVNLSASSVADREDLPLPSPATIMPSPASPAEVVHPDSGLANAGVTNKKSWGRLFKKVSSTRMNSRRPGALEADSRTYSEPVTRDEGSQAEEKSIGGLFGTRRTFRKKSSKPPVPQALAVLETDSSTRSSKRRSFLVLDAFKSPSDSSSMLQLPSPTPQTHQMALRSVLAYLRDLDDLSEETSLPNIPLGTPSPPTLRNSPSLGALSPSISRAESPDVRRVQSTRRPMGSRSPRPTSSRLSQLYDDSSESPEGRNTPIPAGTFSPLPGSIGNGAAIESVRTKNDPVRREAVLKEIVETEQTYLRGLEELCAIYVASSANTVSSNGGRKDPVLPVAERRAVFGNIEAIRDFHRTILLPDLLAAVRAGGESSVVAARVGEVFCQHGSYLKIYSAYVNGFDASLAQIQTWAASSSSSARPSAASGTSATGITSSTMFDAASQIGSTLSQSQKKRIKSWMKRCRAHPSHSQISLESYLLLPVQRIPRYRLLLESLLACTPAPANLNNSLSASTGFLHPDGVPLEPDPSILAAMVEMDLVATNLNESKRETEGRAQLLAWQGRIVNRYKSSLVQPHRTLLRSGKLVLTRSVKRSTTHLEPLAPATSYYPNGSAKSRLGVMGTTMFDANDFGDNSLPADEIHTLFTETLTQELIVLLCTDLLILVKAPAPPLDADPNSPVELYTVVRLNSGAVAGARKGSSNQSPVVGTGTSGEGPVSLFGKDEDMLRIKVGTKAILYLRHPSAPSSPLPSASSSSDTDEVKKRKMEARQWRDAINLQFYINT